MKNRYKNFLKVVTLFSFFTFMLTYDSYAQFGCGTGIPITNGYTQMGITTPGTGGVEDWNTNPTGTSINSSYWNDDVYLFEYTSGATAENISMTIFTRNGWNGIGIFDDCTGTTFSTELDAVGTTTANVSNTVSATIAAGNTVYIAVGQWGTPNDLDFDVTNFTVTQILCPDPSALTATNVTTTSADLGWTENGTATTWDIEWGAAGFTPTGTPTIVGTTTNPHNLTGLTAQTAYEFYVRADCGGSGTSTWVGPFAFTTTCGVITPDHTEPFNTFVPDICWDEADGGDLISGPTSLGSSPWTAGTAIGNTAKINLYTNTRSDWILSPYFDLSVGGYEIVLDVAVTDWNASGSDVMGADDSVRVVYTENGSTWNTLMVFTAADNLPNSLTTFSTLIPSVGNNVQFGILATDGPVDNTQDYDFHVDNFIIRTPPSCPAPSALTVTNLTATTADLGWTENGTATTWDIEWGAAGFTPTGTPTIVGTTTNPHNLTGLTAQTAYEFYVRADCGGNGTSTWAGPFAFTTECAAVVAPWIESFENAGTIPACWSQGASNGENWLFANTGSGNHIGNNGTLTGATTSGNYFAWVDDSSPHSTGTTLESPFIDVTALTNPMLSFFLISDNEGNSNVDFSVDVWDGAAWNTGVYTSNTNTLNGGWEQIDVVLSSLTITGNIRLRFIVDENNGTDFYDDVAIDDVEIKEAPSCPAPSALTAINVTTTAADLGWTENGTATTWDIEWGAAGFTPTGTPNIVGTTTNPHNLTGLTANTSYEFYVRAMCSASDSSAWVGPYVFTTPCNTVTTFPFLEDFETTSTTRDCWTQIEEVGSASWTYATGSSGGAITTAYSGTENARFVSQSGTNSPIVKLVSPVLDLSGVNSPELAFFYGQEIWFSDQNELKVYYRVSVDSAWVQIAHYTSDVAVWTADTLTLPNPSATYQIAFEGINNWGRANVVDDVEVYDAFTCSDPSNLTAFNIQPTSAMLDWTENGTATNWNIEWDVTGFTLGTGNPQAVAAKPYLLTGLIPNTSYDYYVQADCGGGDTSNWVGPFTFATPPCVPIGLNLGADTTLCANQNITLDAGSGSYTYTWSTGGSAQTELIDTTLMGGNGTYNVSVTVVDNVSGCIYTDDINITFQTCTDIDELNGANAFNIYPNPTKGIVNISMAATTANTVLTIVDVQGKVVFTKTNFNISSGVVETIDLSGNDKGIYFVNFTNEQTSIVKKVVLH